MSNLKDLERCYYDRKYQYEKLCEEVSKQVEELINNSSIKLAVPMEKRVKTVESVIEKLDRYNYTDLKQINDIVGIRLIVLFKNDIVKVCSLIEENFDVTRKEDTSERLEENQFGYGSIHYEFVLKNDWCSIPSMSQLKNLSVELQVRTTAQHIWAASSHVLQYKHEMDVPINVKRSINRVAALLELVDLEFLRVLNNQNEYIETITDELGDGLLNVENIKVILSNKLPANNYDGTEKYSDLVTILSNTNIKTINQVSDYIDNNLDEMIKKDNNAVQDILTRANDSNYNYNLDRVNKGVYFNHVGLIRITLGSIK